MQYATVYKEAKKKEIQISNRRGTMDGSRY
jgi:hypothetical protein